MFVHGTDSTSTPFVYDINYLSIPLPQCRDRASLTPYLSCCSTPSSALHLMHYAYSSAEGHEYPHTFTCADHPGVSKVDYPPTGQLCGVVHACTAAAER